MIVANHISYLDGVLLYLCLPLKLAFAINTEIAKTWYVQRLMRWVDFVPMDSSNPLSVRALIKRVNEGGCVMIFPEGRITLTGSLMKVYNGPGLVAVKTGAQVLPVVIEGAQYSPFSRLKGRVRQRLFPKVRLTILPPRHLTLPKHQAGREQREHAGDVLADLMVEMLFKTNHVPQTLFQRLLEARHLHGTRHVIAEDIKREVLDYQRLLSHCLAIRDALPEHIGGQRIAVLATGLDAYIAFWAVQAAGAVAVMLPQEDDGSAMDDALRLSGVKYVLASTSAMHALSAERQALLVERCELFRLDQLTQSTRGCRWRSLRVWTGLCEPARSPCADDDAVVLFTSPRDGRRRAVVLSHHNLLANLHQINTRLALTPQDVVLNVLPLSQAFGLMAGAILPTLNGMRVFQYPQANHVRVIPEIAYDISATVLFADDMLLHGYAEAAHGYDFYSVKYVITCGGMLRQLTRDMWSEKFGLRVLQGYGLTEAAPMVAINSPLDYKAGTVGRPLPGIECTLEAVPGVTEGGLLAIKGPNLMKGYISDADPACVVFPASVVGEGWLVTDELVQIDAEGYIHMMSPCASALNIKEQ